MAVTVKLQLGEQRSDAPDEALTPFAAVSVLG